MKVLADLGQPAPRLAQHEAPPRCGGASPRRSRARVLRWAEGRAPVRRGRRRLPGARCRGRAAGGDRRSRRRSSSRRPSTTRRSPASLKNAIDWVSRPLHRRRSANKPVAVVGASTGRLRRRLVSGRAAQGPWRIRRACGRGRGRASGTPPRTSTRRSAHRRAVEGAARRSPGGMLADLKPAAAPKRRRGPLGRCRRNRSGTDPNMCS